MQRRRRLGGTLALLTVLGLLAPAPSVSAAGMFKTGTYSGKTTQSQKVGFELSSTNACPGSRTSKLCLYQLDSQSANLNLTCPDGTQDGVQELINPAVLPSTGVLRESFGQVDVAGRLSFYIKVQRNATLTGWSEESFSSGGGRPARRARYILREANRRPEALAIMTAGVRPSLANKDRGAEDRSVIYVVLGVLVASQHGYYADLSTASAVLSAVVATALWPLILLGAACISASRACHNPGGRDIHVGARRRRFRRAGAELKPLTLETSFEIATENGLL